MWENNPVSAQGGGALLFFSGLCLVRCLRDFVHSARGKSLHQKLKLSIPVIGFVISVAVLAAWLKWNHIPLLWALLIVGFPCLLTIGLMRIVAEGGIYWFQSHFSFFHLFKVLGLGKVLSPVLLGPLMAIYWVLFLDLKTFLAPNLLNGVKMQQDAGPRECCLCRLPGDRRPQGREACPPPKTRTPARRRSLAVRFAPPSSGLPTISTSAVAPFVRTGA